MRRTDDQLRVRVERALRWVYEQYRTQGARTLVHKARSAASQLLAPPARIRSAPRSASMRSASVQKSFGSREARLEWPQDVLAAVCAGVALRDLNLVDSLLAQLEDMEAHESDPAALDQLYRLDHLATRLRRNAENLRVLAGHDAGSVAGAASPLLDVLRAAMSSIEQYARIEIGRVATLAVVDFAADDVGRLLAELLDNATMQSPPTSKVTVSAHLTELGSVLLRVEDAGIGLPEDRLEALNRRLSTTPRLDREAIEHMGLAVVRRLASKHGIRVKLHRRATHGTTASVLLPAALVCEVPPTSWFAERPTSALSRPTLPTRQVAPGAHPGTGPTGSPARRLGSGHPVVPPPAPRSPIESNQPAMVPPTAPSTAAPSTTAPSTTAPFTGVPSIGPSPASSAGSSAVTPPATTKSGLPRRVPQSLRDFAASSSGSNSAAVGEPVADSDSKEAGERLIADLGAFSEGEKAARDARAGKQAEGVDQAKEPTDKTQPKDYE